MLLPLADIHTAVTALRIQLGAGVTRTLLSRSPPVTTPSLLCTQQRHRLLKHPTPLHQLLSRPRRRLAVLALLQRAFLGWLLPRALLFLHFEEPNRVECCG